MSRVPLLLLLLSSFAAVYGMKCEYDSSISLVRKIMDSCPRVFDPPEKSYCCIDLSGESEPYCCDEEEFLKTTGLGLLIPVIIAVVIIISLVICCVSCMCCSCCLWYRRRHQGTVYGKVHTPGVVHSIHITSNAPPPTQVPQVPNAPPYPVHTGMPQAPPYQYGNEVYPKQMPQT